MLNIAICDDDIQITGKIERLLQDIAKRNFVDTEIEVFWNGKSLADAIAAGERYDVIYLDIEMDKEDGISAARRIRTYDKNVRIIYVTSHESYMRESFEVRPFQFLVKPVTDKIMEKCFKSVYEDINSEDFYFRYSYQRMNHKVPIKDILYFESNKRKIFIVTEQEILELYGKLNEIEETLKTCKISFLDILLCLWAVYLFFFYFDIFFARKRKRYLSVIGITLFVIWQFGITTIISFPAYINIAVTIMFTFLAVMMTYEGRWWNKGVFVITFNAIWMLMETLCNYILLTYCPQYAAVRQVGSFVSKIFFNAVILALKKVFTDDDIKELPVRYSILLVLIPTGSIYIMNNIFMLGFANNNGRTRINSTFTVLILLGMNILIFYVYMKLADDLRLRRMAAVYEQQLELCERHQQERELSMLQLRDIKHNMKNNLISILAYAENKEYEKMTGFIEEIMGEGGMVIASISNSGNIVIDSLIGYWYVTAQNKRIIFKTDICIPMIMPFKGADLSLILGNLLENAVEAAEKVEENRYINVKMKFDKNNLLLFVDNSYKGKLLKTRDNRLKSTKSDAENHGVGLASVYRAVAKYHGSVVIEDSEPGKFKIRIVLYSNVQE